MTVGMRSRIGNCVGNDLESVVMTRNGSRKWNDVGMHSRIRKSLGMTRNVDPDPDLFRKSVGMTRNAFPALEMVRIGRNGSEFVSRS